MSCLGPDGVVIRVRAWEEIQFFHETTLGLGDVRFGLLPRSLMVELRVRQSPKPKDRF